MRPGSMKGDREGHRGQDAQSKVRETTRRLAAIAARAEAQDMTRLRKKRPLEGKGRPPLPWKAQARRKKKEEGEGQ